MNSSEEILKDTIASYCLGLLSAEEADALEQLAKHDAGVRNVINAFMLSLEEYLLGNAVEPGENVKSKTFDLIQNLQLENERNINDLPLVNKYTDHNNWLQIVKPLLPAELEGDFFTRELRKDENVLQTLLWINVDYPDEVHDDVQESFIILKGRCCCYIGDEVIELGPGGFVEIPLYQHHDVKVLETIIAVVQRVKVA